MDHAETEEQTDPFASNSQHIIRKRTRNETNLENHSSTCINRKKITCVNGLSTSENKSCANQPSNYASFRPAPFNDDPEAVETRAKCDYSIQITKEMATSGTAPRPVRVYADGTYDLFHKGHAKLLMQAKNAFPSVYLIAGVDSDFLTHQNKGKTVMTEEERYEIVRHCRYVDEVVKDVPWVTHDAFIKENKIDFVAHDDLPYSMGSEEDIYKHLKDKGIFIATERTEGVSTSDLVVRVVRDYDMYVRRNLDRGYTGKDMNLSFLIEKKFLLQNKMDTIKESIEGKTQEILHDWQEKIRKLINNFLDLFNKNSNVDFIWKEDDGRRRLSSPETPNGSSMRRLPAPSVKSCPMDARSTRRTFKNLLTSNFVYLCAILLFSLFIHFLPK